MADERGSRQRSVVSVMGSLNTDFRWLVPRMTEAGETLTALDFSQGPGGKGANQAVACKRLSTRKSSSTAVVRARRGWTEERCQRVDVEVRMQGLVGDDRLGAELVKTLERDGITTTRIKTVQGLKTGVANVVVDQETGENAITLFPGANGVSEGREEVEPDADVVVLQLETPTDAVKRDIIRAKSQGAIVRVTLTKRRTNPLVSTGRANRLGNDQVILNPAPALPLDDETLRHVDHLIMNQSEAAIISGDDSLRGTIDSAADVDEFVNRLGTMARQLINKGVCNVIVTLGRHGTCHQSAEGIKRNHPPLLVPAQRVDKVVDTTAAGDTFVGAYALDVALARAEGRQDQTADRILFANRAAAVTVQRAGAQDSIPWADEVHVELE